MRLVSSFYPNTSFIQAQVHATLGKQMRCYLLLLKRVSFDPNGVTFDPNGVTFDPNGVTFDPNGVTSGSRTLC